MSRVKNWGFGIARQLFGSNMTIDEVVVNEFSIHEHDRQEAIKKGLPDPGLCDRDWLEDQITAIAHNRAGWGY